MKMKQDVSVANKNEAQLWAGRPSHLSRLGTYLFCAVLGILAVPAGVLLETLVPQPEWQPIRTGIAWAMFGTPVFLAFWAWLGIVRHRYELTTERLIEHTGIFRNSEPLELYSIVDYQLPPAYLMALFGLGDVVLETSDKRQPRVVIQSVANRVWLYEQIRQRVEQLRLEKKGYFDRQ
jgi:membrane protein YdbS with pleckstrin-like domain